MKGSYLFRPLYAFYLNISHNKPKNISVCFVLAFMAMCRKISTQNSNLAKILQSNEINLLKVNKRFTFQTRKINLDGYNVAFNVKLHLFAFNMSNGVGRNTSIIQ